jgi:hypothetical protein
MKALYFPLWATLPMVLFFHASPSFAQSPCDTPEVKLGNNYFQVAPTGVDDTANIQCALDLAVERRIPEIRLTRGDFYIGALLARGFSGTLQGSGQDHTRISLLEQAIECGYAPSAITFEGGEPRIRWLHLVWEPGVQPCIGGSGWLGSLLNFTGGTGDESSCVTDVIYATVDRVTLDGPARGSADAPDFTSGVKAWARDGASPDCRNLLLGTLRVNRSRISQFGTGIGLSMEGGAQAGIFRNILDGNHSGLFVSNSNATVIVAGNHFSSVPMETPSSCHGAGVGINVTNWRPQQGSVRLDVHSNVFDVSQGGWCSGFGVWMTREPEAPGVAVVISDSWFALSGHDPGVTGIQALGVAGAVVSGNAFRIQSGGNQALYLGSRNAADATAWTVVSNSGLETPVNSVDIVLGEGTNQALIGPGQGADVRDNGYDNTVLPQ